MTNTDSLRSHLALIALDPTTFNSRTRSKFRSTLKANIADYVYAYANGKCVSCGQATDRDGSGDNASVLGHLIAATSFGAPNKDRAGWIPGNLANMCFICNDDAGERSFSADEVIAELVPLTWEVSAKREAKPESEYAKISRANRRW